VRRQRSHFQQSSSQSERVARDDHFPCVSNQDSAVANVRDDRRHSARHGFADRVWKALADRGAHRQIQRRLYCVDVGSLTQRVGPTDEAVLPDPICELCIPWVASPTSKEKRAPRVPRRDDACGCEESSMVFHAVKPGNEPHEKGIVAAQFPSDALAFGWVRAE
jgi:hypothetical protein